jgi:hypothetical protein
VHPYISLSSNYGDAGEHNSGSFNTVYQVSLQQGKKNNYLLPNFGDKAVYYDGFFENISLYEKLGLVSEELCLDLQGGRHNCQKKRYWLTTEVHDYKTLKTFGLNYRPIEANILLNTPGRQVFLYDTNIAEKNLVKDNRSVKLYPYYLRNMFIFVRKYGYANVFRDFLDIVKQVCKKYKKKRKMS